VAVAVAQVQDGFGDVPCEPTSPESVVSGGSTASQRSPVRRRSAQKPPIRTSSGSLVGDGDSSLPPIGNNGGGSSSSTTNAMAVPDSLDGRPCRCDDARPSLTGSITQDHRGGVSITQHLVSPPLSRGSSSQDSLGPAVGLGGCRRDSIAAGSPVWLHVYDVDPYTGWMNRAFLHGMSIGVYHAGVEIFQEEWAFQYFEDTWEDESISGIMRCRPKQMAEFVYRESIFMGQTKLSAWEVDCIISSMHDEWPASSYHLTRRNCLTFAEALCSQLGVPTDFPEWLKGVCETANQSMPLGAMVDYGWSWGKWWMIRKHAAAPDTTPEEDEAAAAAAAANPSLFWSVLLSPGQACAGGFGLLAVDGVRPDEETEARFEVQGRQQLRQPPGTGGGKAAADAIEAPAAAAASAASAAATAARRDDSRNPPLFGGDSAVAPPVASR